MASIEELRAQAQQAREEAETKLREARELEQKTRLMERYDDRVLAHVVRELMAQDDGLRQHIEPVFLSRREALVDEWEKQRTKDNEAKRIKREQSKQAEDKAAAARTRKTRAKHADSSPVTAPDPTPDAVAQAVVLDDDNQPSHPTNETGRVAGGRPIVSPAKPAGQPNG